MSRPAVLILLLFATLASAQNRKEPPYLVKSAEGRVLAWEPWTSGWTPIVPKMRLWESTLVQVGKNSSLTVEAKTKGEFKGLRADTVQIKLNSPIVLRLDENVLRKVKLNSYFIPSFPDITKKEDVASNSKNPLYLDFKEAWDRFAAVLARNNRRVDSLWSFFNPEKETNDAEVAVRSKKLRIFTPRDGTIVMLEKPSVSLKVTWRKIPEPDVLYEVRLWKSDELQGPPLAVTPYDYHIVKLTEEGSYYLQVSAQDGRYQSSVVRLAVAEPLTKETQPFKNKFVPEKPLPLVSPPANFTLSGQLPVTLGFEWLSEEPIPEDTHYELILMDRSGKITMRHESKKRMFEMKFDKPGEFRWRVESYRGAHKMERLFSETRNLRLLGAQSTPDPLAELFASKKSGFLYLEAGLPSLNGR